MVLKIFIKRRFIIVLTIAYNFPLFIMVAFCVKQRTAVIISVGFFFWTDFFRDFATRRVVLSAIKVRLVEFLKSLLKEIRRRSWECISPPSKFLKTPRFGKICGFTSGLSLGTRMSNLKSVALTVLELLAFNAQKLRGSRDRGHAPFWENFWGSCPDCRWEYLCQIWSP